MSILKRALVTVVSTAGIAAVVLSSSESPADAQKAFPTYPSRNAFGVATTNMAEATAFCSQACDLSGPQGGAKCTRVPTGDGLLPESSPLLSPVPKLTYVKANADVRASKEVIDGLKKLDTWLAASPERAKYNYSVRVSNCWRDGIDEIKKECYFVMKGKNPVNLGLTYPGANPHSGGKACDIVLVDAKGNTATSCSANTKTNAGIDFKTASRLLDEALTNDTVGAKRLNYEAWHYEWGGPSACRCKAPECQNDFWPPLCGADGSKSCQKK